MNELLNVQHLSLKIGEKQVLTDLSFTLKSSEILGLAGESGSGKTLTGMTLMGLQPKSATVKGAAFFEGVNLVTCSERDLNRLRGSKIAMVFQDPASALHPMLNIGHQLTDHLRQHETLSRATAKKSALAALELLHIPDPESALRQYPHEFSGGQLQRIAIAMAIICNPSFLIADEPTTALDVIVQAEILRELRQLCDALGMGMIFISHDLGALSAIADRISVMRDGKVLETGATREVLLHPSHPYTRELLAALPTREQRQAEENSRQAEEI